MLGFTFAYGSLFAKIWIVHRMGANESQEIASKVKEEVKFLTYFFFVVLLSLFFLGGRCSMG